MRNPRTKRINEMRFIHCTLNAIFNPHPAFSEGVSAAAPRARDKWVGVALSAFHSGKLWWHC